MIQCTTLVRVRYADTDQMRYVYYGKYFEYFEQGRSDLLRSIGLPYPQLEAMGFFLPVIEAHAAYRKAARYDDALVVHTSLKQKPIARIRIEYEVVREGESDPIAVGHTVHTFVNATTGRPARAPAQFVEIIGQRMR